MKSKLLLIAFISQIVLLFVSCSNEANKSKEKQKDAVVSNPQAERDFKEIDSLRLVFCDYPEECEKFEKSTYLEKRIFEDNISKLKIHKALNFLRSYPKDPNYFEVLKVFFGMHNEPHFIAENMSDSLVAFLSKDIPYNTSAYYHRAKSLPVDLEAKNEWLKEGYDLAKEFIQSNETIEEKISIEILVEAREYRQAYYLYFFQFVQKEGNETAYWEQFNNHYWERFRLRMGNLVKKYPESEIMAVYVGQLIGLVTNFSPGIAESWWEYFLNLTNVDQSSDNHKGFKAIHDMAKLNLKALERLDYSKPLDIAFTAIDGSEIDLKKMRGKVVLVDFWALGCAPCIREMPHVQALYEKYRDQGFEVIGLVANGNDSKQRVLKITKNQGATWPQFLDKGKDVILSYHTLYNIHGYPTVWLLNKDGIIVDRNARNERLEPLIRKYLESE